MNKKTKATISIAILGCIIGTLGGRVIVNSPYWEASVTLEEQEEQTEEKPTAESLGMTLEDKENVINSDLQGELNKLQKEMNNATSQYEEEQKAAKEATLKSEENHKKSEEAAKKAGKNRENDITEESNSGGNNENDGSSKPENASGEVEGDVIEGLDDEYYDDYTEDMNVEVPLSDSELKVDPSILGDNVMFTYDMDFGDPNAPEHQNNYDSFVPTVDLSGWNGTFH